MKNLASLTLARGCAAPRSVLGAPNLLRPDQGPHSAAVADAVGVSVRGIVTALHVCVLHDRRLVTIHRWRRFRGGRGLFNTTQPPQR